MRTDFLVKEKVFFNKWIYDDAERAFYCKSALTHKPEAQVSSYVSSSISTEFAKVREQIRSQLGSVPSDVNVSEISNRLNKLELENTELKNLTKKLQARISVLELGGKPVDGIANRLDKLATENGDFKSLIKKLEARIAELEKGGKAAAAPAAAPKPAAANDDDDFDLFADEVEEESEEKEKIKAARVEAYNAKKSKKEAIIAKSTIIMDVKPWDDETDMKALEASVRAIEMDGLLWGTGKLVPVAYGVKKLQITCVIEDDKVSTELLEEKICENENYVQSVDIVSFNKI